MPFEFAPVIPANTAKTDAIETKCVLHPGTITKLEIEYPAGCAGLVHSEVYHWDVKLWPKNEEGTFTGDDIVISSNPQHDLSASPYELVFKTWNLDDTYQHTPRYRIEVTDSGKSLLGQLKRLFLIGA